MKRLLIIASIFFLLFPTLAKPALAADYELLPAGRTIDSDYIRGAETIQIDGDINGDAFLAGGIVTVNGRISGDLFVLGGKVNISGPVGNSIRVLGGDVTINSPVNRNVLLLCGNCNLTNQTAISGSLLVAGANLEVSAGKIGRGFRFLGNRLYLNSEINNEAFVVADKEFLLGPRASISGNLKYTGSREVTREPGATVGGSIAYQKTTVDENYPRFFGARTILSSYQRIRPLVEFASFAIMALIGFILLGLFPRIFERTVRALEKQPLASFSWGIIVTVMVPVVAVLFAVTIIGLPVSLALVILGYIVGILAQYLTAFFIGRRILLARFGERRGWAILLGLAMLAGLGLIPIFGVVIKLVLVLFALGGLVLSYRQPAIIEPKPLPKPRKSSRG
jgi:hypothetical protein